MSEELVERLSRAVYDEQIKHVDWGPVHSPNEDAYPPYEDLEPAIKMDVRAMLAAWNDLAPPSRALAKALASAITMLETVRVQDENSVEDEEEAQEAWDASVNEIRAVLQHAQGEAQVSDAELQSEGSGSPDTKDSQ